MQELTSFGNELKAVLKESGVRTISILSEKIATSQPFLSAVCRGRRPVTMGLISRIITVVGIQYLDRLVNAAGDLNDDRITPKTQKLLKQLELARRDYEQVLCRKSRPLKLSLREEVKEVATQAGFKLKEQPDGSLDLNPYVYEFAALIMSKSYGDGWFSGYGECLEDNKLPEDVDLIKGSEIAESEYADRIRGGCYTDKDGILRSPDGSRSIFCDVDQ